MFICLSAIKNKVLSSHIAECCYWLQKNEFLHNTLVSFVLFYVVFYSSIQMSKSHMIKCY
jgi:hypothetical protein